MSAPQPTNPPSAKFTDLPNELVLIAAHYMTIRSLRGLSVASKRYHDLLDREFLFREEVEDERLFEAAQQRYEHLDQTKGLRCGVQRNAPWPTSMFVLQPVSDFVESSTPLSEDDYAFLHDSVGRWGRGVLFLNPNCYSTYLCPTWTMCKALLNELPVSQTRKSLIHRAIEKCSDIKVVEQVINTYLKMHLASLQGTTGRGRLPGAINQDCSINLIPPVFWASVHNRVDVLNLLLEKNNENGRRTEERIDFNLVFNMRAQDAVRSDLSIGLHFPCSYIDAWKAAFYHPEIASIVSRGSFYVSEDVCLWLLDKNLGFPTQIYDNLHRYLSKAAAFKKVRVLRALITHLKSRMSRGDFQRAVTQALHTTTRVRYQGLYLGLDLQNNDPVCDGHEEVIDILVGAGASLSLSYATQQSQYTNGDISSFHHLLQQALQWSPRNAVHLLRHQLAQGATHHPDLKKALHLCIKYADRDSGSRNNTHPRVEFFRMVFPANVHLLRLSHDLQPPGIRAKVYQRFLGSLARELRKGLAYRIVQRSEFHRMALYLVQVAGHEPEVAHLLPWVPALAGPSQE